MTPVVVSWVGVRHGWRVALLLVTAVGLPVFALFYAKVRPTEPTDPSISFREQVRVDLLKELLSRPEISFTVWLGVATEFINQGLLSFLPTFLVEYHGYTPTEAGLLFSAFFLVLAVGGVVVGNLSDRYGRDLAIGGCMVIAAVGSAVVLGGSTTPVVLAGVMLLGLGTCAVIVVQPRILDHLEEGEEGTGFGLVRTVYMILGSAGSVTLGFLADTLDWVVAIGTITALCVLVVGSFGAIYYVGLGE